MSKFVAAAGVVAITVAAMITLAPKDPRDTDATEAPRAVVEGIDPADPRVQSATEDIAPLAPAVLDLQVTGDAELDAAAAIAPGGPQPHDMENLVLQYIGRVPDLKLTGINSVKCDAKQCEIAFTGTDANPQYVDQYMDLSRRVWMQIFDDGYASVFTGGMATREIAPGAKEYVMGFTYVAIDPPSRDPLIAAIQHAACAGAWSLRADEAESSNRHEVAEKARDSAKRELAVAIPVLGEARATGIAKARAEGPLLRQCTGARSWMGR